MSTSIALDRLTKRFGKGTPAVDAVSLQIEAGELFFLLGPSGCGKTTLLRMIAGFIEPTGGDIVFATPDGKKRNVTHLAPNKRNTGMVFQSYALWPHMTVAANVAFGLTVRGISPDEKDRRVAEALELVRMGEYASRKPTQLSGGQQQRVALARALVIRPDVLLLDEPLSNLDAKLRIELRAEIRRICKEARSGSASNDSGQGMTAIYVTHDQKEALSMADRVAIMRDGHVVQTGAPRDLYRNPASTFVAEFLGETNFIPGALAGPAHDSLVRVTTPAGTLLGRPAKGVGPGAPVTCSIRPEAVRLVTPGSDAAAPLSGRVTRTTFLGEMAQLDVALNGAPDAPTIELKVSVMNPAVPIAQGAPLSLAVDPDDVVVLPATDTPSR